MSPRRARQPKIENGARRARVKRSKAGNGVGVGDGEEGAGFPTAPCCWWKTPKAALARSRRLAELLLLLPVAADRISPAGQLSDGETESSPC